MFVNRQRRSQDVFMRKRRRAAYFIIITNPTPLRKSFLANATCEGRQGERAQETVRILARRTAETIVQHAKTGCNKAGKICMAAHSRLAACRGGNA